MPKIVINEYDLTKAGTGEYSNFSVVVPGFLAKDKYVFVEVEDEATGSYIHKYDLSADAKAVFDENGIYECNNIADFEANIGKRAATINCCFEAAGSVAPAPTSMICYDKYYAGAGDYGCETEGGVTKFIYKNYDAFTTAFNLVLEGKIPTSVADMVPITLNAVEPSDDFGLYYAEARKDNGIHVGRLLDKSVQYFAVNKATYGPVHMPDANAAAESGELVLEATETPIYDCYYIIHKDKIGTNGTYVEDRISHYGNQMAYELIGMGYTVLFKAMTEHSDDEIKIIAAKKNENSGEIVYDASGNLVYDFANKKVFETKGEQVFVDVDGALVLNSNFSAINQLSEASFWECLKDKSTYDFRYLVTGLLTHNDGANKCILEVADHSEEIALDDASIHDGRGDCIALIDLDSAAYAGKTQSQAIPNLAKEAANWGSAYAAVFAPYVTYLMADDAKYENNKTFPASFHYLACAANSANNNFSEWYANAGYTRGVSKYTIESTGCKFGEIAIQSLEPRFLLNVGKTKDKDGKYVEVNTSVAVNLIVKIKSSYYLWGNRTGKTLGTRGASDGDLRAQHFLNIRQLCTTIKKQVYTTCRRLTFDPNSNVLWINFRDLLTPMLEQMKADQGIKDYQIVKNATDRKALLSAKIRIVPIEAVEDFEIGLYLEDSLDEVALTEA